jgi:hypothetical protein
MARPPKKTFVQQHSLSLAASVILVIWIVSYCFSDPSTHVGSFFGNAIADWTGMLVTVLATKFWFEKGSAESRQPHNEGLWGWHRLMHEHSLSVFLVVTGVGWVLLFAHMNSEGKWGQVVGNIVSEWTQILGLVLLTKRLIEWHSKESQR